MNESIIEIYSSTLLTLIGLVLPIVSIAAGVFSEGYKVLKSSYENIQSHAENNLKSILLEKKGEDVDIEAISNNIKSLKKTKRDAKKKMDYLDPNIILLRGGGALTYSLCFFVLELQLIDLTFYKTGIFFLISSFILLLYGANTLLNSIKVTMEASVTIQNNKKDSEQKVIDLLSELVDNSKKGEDSLFVDGDKIQISINDKIIQKGSIFEYSNNNKHPIKISILNSSEYMLKRFELGFTLPQEFLIEGENISNTTTTEKEKIIRFEEDHIQARSLIQKKPVIVTALKAGVYNVDYFINAENVKNKIIEFKIKIVN